VHEADAARFVRIEALPGLRVAPDLARAARERIQLRSAPAWKCLPAPRSKTTRREGSLPRASMAPSAPAMNVPSYALLTSGRLNVTVATPRGSMRQWIGEEGMAVSS
jgi:hypothetical protein